MRLFDPPASAAAMFSGDKILSHCEALASLREGGNPAPITVELDLTNVCQLACPYCTNSVYRAEHREWLPARIVEVVLSDLADLGAKAVTFTGGGEPLCHPEAEELIGYARSRGLDVALITNGGLLDRVQDLPRLLSQLEWLRVSVDAHDHESYQRSKGRDRFEQVMDNIRRLVGGRQQSGAHCTLGVGYLTDAANVEYAAEAAALFANTGVDYLQFRPVTFMPGDERRERFVTAVPLASLMLAQQYEHEDFRVLASLPKYEDVDRSDKAPFTWCSGVYFSCVVGATGDVWICCHFRGYPKFSLGNVRQRSFADIWGDVEHRRSVYDQIDLRRCMPLCRFWGQNKLLNKINFNPEHRNFL